MKSFLIRLKTTCLQLSLKKKVVAIISFSLLLIGLILLLGNFYLKITAVQPEEGGTIQFGLIGHPLYINPVLSSNNGCDQNISELIYDGLYAVDGKGNLIPRLAEKTEISPDRKTYTIFLKDNIIWHDGVEFSADDVVYTVKTIQNPAINSPFRLKWAGVTVEKIGSGIIRFHLSNPYEPFLQNLTFKIIPQHIWKDILTNNFPHTEYNLKPIGTGPYLFDNLEKTHDGYIIRYSLISNKDYFQGVPKIDHLIFHFFNDYPEMKEAFFQGKIDGFSPLSLEDADFFAHKRNYQIHQLELPRYFAVFFNLNKKIFIKEVREALDLSISRPDLIKEVLHNQALSVTDPISPNFWANIDQDNKYSPEQAKLLLAGENGSASPLHFTLTLPNDPQLVKVASFLKKSWEEIGVEIELQILPRSILEKDIISSRSYDALLFGEIVGQDPDLFSFWHSSQAASPGLNLSAYRNKELDKLIEETRQISDKGKREENIIQIQKILQEDKPAIFLYNPLFLTVLPKQIKGNNIGMANLPQEQWEDIKDWYLYTQRYFHF